MDDRSTQATTAAVRSGLRECTNALRTSNGDTQWRTRTESLLESAREQCQDNPRLDQLIDAADALLGTLAKVRDAQSREILIDMAHQFIDLSRLKTVRRAAYPAEGDSKGAAWMNRICTLIEASHFNIGRMFRQRVRAYPNRTLFVVPQGEDFTEYTWQQVADRTTAYARGINAIGGQDAKVAIFSPNCLESALIDLACLTHGIFNTMVAANAVETQLKHILAESGANILVVSGTEPLQHAISALAMVDSLRWVVSIDSLTRAIDENVITLEELIDRGTQCASEETVGRRLGIRETATTMYTSGTTGLPKGIRFSNLNLVTKRYARAAALPEIDEDETFLCYLPLYHTFGRFLEMLASVHLAATYIFAESASTETLVKHMQQFRPTAMISVPKKWVDLYELLQGSDADAAPLKDVPSKLASLTGGRLTWGLSAAGRLDPTVFRFFQSHGVDLLSGYGMTEATGGITMTPPGGYIEDSIGKALPAIELRQEEDGELLLRGPYVSDGYTDPRDDAAAFRDGWFCTGDIVSRDDAGYLRHVDRKKDIYKNSSGRTIAPQRVESLFADFPEISRVFAVGDGRDYVTLLIRPNIVYAEVGFDRMTDAEKHEYFRGLVASCNRFLAPFERVVRFALIERDFSRERGELTDKDSFRRSIVEKNFAHIIATMYESSTIERVVDGLRVKVPISFLQHLGTTATGVLAESDGLTFRAIGKKLRIRPDPCVADRVWIGNCCYDAIERGVDLDNWFRLPQLWVGNAELTHLSGESIVQWSRSSEEHSSTSRLVAIEPPDVLIDDWLARLDASAEESPKLLSIHAAAVALSCTESSAAIRAVEVLARAITTGRVQYQELSERHLRYVASHEQIEVRSRAFMTLYEHQEAEEFGTSAAAFCGSLRNFLDDIAVERIAKIGMRPQQWSRLTAATASLRQSTAHGGATRAVRFVESLLESLGRIAHLSSDYYLPVRRELAAWRLAPVPEILQSKAVIVEDRITGHCRQTLGDKQTEAVEPSAQRRYTWGETLRFEDGIDPNEKARITDAVRHTELVREAVFLLHLKRRIDLEDLAPDSIWISLLGARFGKSVYHAGVRLRNGERCDFNLYVRGTAPVDSFLTDLSLSCLAAGGPNEGPLTPQLGGYWNDHGIATVEHIAAESVEAMLRHMHQHPDREVCQRLTSAWRHLAWSTLTAAFEFYRRTEGRWILTGPVAQDICVPIDDFVDETRISTTSGWRQFDGALNMLLQLKGAFLDRVRFHFPAVAGESDDDLLFAAVLEANGLRGGLAFLESALRTIDETRDPSDEMLILGGHMRSYVVRTKKNGYMPRALYFAVQRYRDWARQVPDADVFARAAQLRELQKNYRIHEAAAKFPGSRLWLYAETVLASSPPEGRDTITKAIARLRSGAKIREVLGRLYADLQAKLPSQDHQYFLARAAYPHLDLDEKAQLVTTSEVGQEDAQLVTTHIDRTGGELRIRPVANSRELDTLHRIFYVGGIGGGTTAHETFLVVEDGEGFIVAGVGSIRRTPGHVILDKIAVLPRCRGRGIGELLLHEFIRRQRADRAEIVSAEFIRAGWLTQFGFVSHPRYAGLVLELDTADS